MTTFIKFNGGITSFEKQPVCFNCGFDSTIEEIKFFDGQCQSCFYDSSETQMNDQEDVLV